MKKIFDGQRNQFAAIEPSDLPVLDPSFVQRFLLWIPPTDELLAEQAKLEEVIKDETSPDGVRRAASRRLDDLQLSLRRAIQRDTLAVGRPKSCWCLGVGGSGPRFVMSPTDHAQVSQFDRYCDCPDGERMKDEHQKNTEKIRSVIVEQRLDILRKSLPVGMTGLTLRSYVEAGGSRELARDLVRWLPETVEDGIHDPFAPWLYLFGQTGVMKTGLAVPLLVESVRTGRTGRFVVVPDMLEVMRAKFGEKKPERDDDMEGLFTTDLLVLDDLGAERTSDWTVERLYLLIASRYTKRLRTIITSNLSIESLRSHLGQDEKGRRVPSRIVELCGEWIINVEGDDQRMKAAKTKS